MKLELTKMEKEHLRKCVKGEKDLIDDYEDLYYKLFNHYCNNGEMPYGVAKARTGMPDEWILDHVTKDFNL